MTDSAWNTCRAAALIKIIQDEQCRRVLPSRLANREVATMKDVPSTICADAGRMRASGPLATRSECFTASMARRFAAFCWLACAAALTARIASADSTGFPDDPVAYS